MPGRTKKDATRALRLNMIIDHLNKKTPYGGVTVKELAEKFEVSVRQIYRDLNTIEDCLHVPLVRQESGRTVRLRLKTGYLPGMSPQAATAVFLSLLQQKGSALSGWINEIKDALISTLSYRESPGYFLAVTLADRTGSVEGCLWEGAEEAGDLLVAGAILHDIGKVEEYRCRGSIEQTDEGRLLGHIVTGAIAVDRAASRIPGFPEELRLKLLHMIVSHHGRYEWQSPKRPKFLEAALLHHLDLLDAQADMFTRAARVDGNSSWTEWVKELERYVYRR